MRGRAQEVGARLAGLMLPLVVLAAFAGCANSYKAKRQGAAAGESAALSKRPTGKGYASLLKHAACDTGFISVYTVNDDHETKRYFSVPRDVWGREILVVNKVTSVPAKLGETGMNRGANYRNMLIRLSPSPDGSKLDIREVDPEVECDSGSSICESVRANYVSSLVASLPIAAVEGDSLAVLVEITSLFDGSEKALQNVFGVAGLGTSPKTSLSRIIKTKAFSTNVVVYSELTTPVFGAEERMTLTVGVASNWYLLPEEKMVPRFADERVGIFTMPKQYYRDAQQRVEERKVITRWRLEPRPEDRERYLLGDLVEPEKPIVFYIDKATPTQWVPFIKQGIEDWQVAFEHAGFKNAIVAREVPKESTDFDLDDARYSSVVYAASTMANAMGPSVCDPRTGEIVESDVMWWHNVLGAVHRWLRLQTGLLNPAVRANEIPDEEMGKAVRFIAAHEIGHTLGLMHNMASSAAYSVDSLRSPSFTAAHGTAPSIMDYARFNYVAQPGDGVTQLYPKIGEYDCYAIEFAYRWRGAKTPYEELQAQRSLVAAHANDPVYFFGPQSSSRSILDPRSQSEDIGNDAVVASKLGLKSLKAILPQVLEWADAKNGEYLAAGKFLHDVIDQWHMYAYHVMANVGGVYLNDRDYAVEKASFAFVPKAKQREAVRYLIDEAFVYPKWLFGGDIYTKIFPVKSSPDGPYEYAPMELFKNYQGYLLWDLLDDERLARMVENEARNGKKAYSVLEMFDDLRKVLFAPTVRGVALTAYERIAQKNYVDALIIAGDRTVAVKNRKALLEGAFGIRPEEQAKGYLCSGRAAQKDDERGFVNANRRIKFDQLSRIGDQLSLKRGELMRLRDLMKRGVSHSDLATRYHYKDLILRINDALGE